LLAAAQWTIDFDPRNCPCLAPPERRCGAGGRQKGNDVTDEIIVKDSNGAKLADGDSVTLDETGEGARPQNRIFEKGIAANPVQLRL
jgi:hypothetical protein